MWTAPSAIRSAGVYISSKPSSRFWESGDPSADPTSSGLIQETLEVALELLKKVPASASQLKVA
jgi:hypothetical protein